jgi:hypothetical protein
MVLISIVLIRLMLRIKFDEKDLVDKIILTNAIYNHLSKI